jgi:hypothetical protein
VKETRADWRNIKQGHPLKVRGASGDFTFRSASFVDGECVSVCVIGGKANHAQFRHFTPDRIIVKRVRAESRPSAESQDSA